MDRKARFFIYNFHFAASKKLVWLHVIFDNKTTKFTWTFEDGFCKLHDLKSKNIIFPPKNEKIKYQYPGG